MTDYLKDDERKMQECIDKRVSVSAPVKQVGILLSRLSAEREAREKAETNSIKGTAEDVNQMLGISQMLGEGRDERNRLEQLILDSQRAADCVVRPTHELPAAIAEWKQRAEKLEEYESRITALTAALQKAEAELATALAAYDRAVLQHEDWDKKRIVELQEIRAERTKFKAERDVLNKRIITQAESIVQYQANEDRLATERDRQYEFNAGMIVKQAELEAELEQYRERERWIPVSERLPKAGDEVLILIMAIKGEPARTAADRHRGARGWYNWEDKYVTHWRPLPLPPEEK